VFIVLAYNFYPVATQRIDAWIFGTEGLTHDKMAMATLTNGGFFGLGPGLGIKKYSLPEGHTDYIFSVIGEELRSVGVHAYRHFIFRHIGPHHHSPAG